MTSLTERKDPFDFSEDSLRARAASRLLASPPATNGSTSPSDYDLDPTVHRTLGIPKPAAVLVPIVARDSLTVLLTLRTGEIGEGASSRHAGQIAFPGGKIEKHDVSERAAALREAEEEIGLVAAHIECLGYTEPYVTGTGYVVTPVIALVRPGFSLTPNPAEVADIFEVPFEFLMDEANHRIDSFVWRGVERHFYAMPYQERYIWGATAGILRALHRRLFK